MKKRFRYLMLVCILALLCLGLTSCGAKLEYTATLLTDAQVGVSYSVSVATATKIKLSTNSPMMVLEIVRTQRYFPLVKDFIRAITTAFEKLPNR